MTERTKCEVLERLKECPLFFGVSDEFLAAIPESPNSTIQKERRGTVLLSPQEFERKIGLVLRGTVQVSKGGVVMSTLKAGEVFGAVTLYSNESYYVTSVVAQTDVWVLFLNGAAMDALLEQNATIAKNYISYLTQRIYFLNRKIDGFTSQGAKKKLVLFLQDALDKSGAQVRLPFSLTQLAERLNVSRASLYRAFDELEQEQILSREGKAIMVHQPERLRQTY